MFGVSVIRHRENKQSRQTWDCCQTRRAPRIVDQAPGVVLAGYPGQALWDWSVASAGFSSRSFQKVSIHSKTAKSPSC